MKNIPLVITDKELEMIDEALADFDPSVSPSEFIGQNLKKAFQNLMEGGSQEDASKEFEASMEKAKEEFESKKKNAKTQCLLLRAKLAQAATRACEHEETEEGK